MCETPVPDMLCLCGRIYKDRFCEDNDQNALGKAIEWYVTQTNKINIHIFLLIFWTNFHIFLHKRGSIGTCNCSVICTSVLRFRHYIVGTKKGLRRNKMSTQELTWPLCLSYLGRISRLLLHYKELVMCLTYKHHNQI